MIVQRRPELFEVVEGYRKAAGTADLVDVDYDDTSCAGYSLHGVLCYKVGELLRAVLKDVAYSTD